MKTEAGNKLMAEFMGYVQSEEHNVHLLSVNHGFMGSNGYTKPFIRKDQYDQLMWFYNSKQMTEIDKFYESTRSSSRLPYVFNGVHLFLCAWNNRSTKLDWMSSKLKYHESWNMLMEVVEKIESLGGIVKIHGNTCDLQFKFGGIGHYNTQATKIEAVWGACAEYIQYYNKHVKV